MFTASLRSRRLSRVYVLTNRHPEWLVELKDVLQGSGADKWARIGTSCDLHFTREQQHNAQAIDITAAQCAEVFLGK